MITAPTNEEESNLKRTQWFMQVNPIVFDATDGKLLYSVIILSERLNTVLKEKFSMPAGHQNNGEIL